MSLRRSPRLTPASLAARRANALKSTGPRSERGKARSCLNALRNGRYTADLRAKLERAGEFDALFLFDWIYAHIYEALEPVSPRHRLWHRRWASRVWCDVTGRSLFARRRTPQPKDRQPGFANRTQPAPSKVTGRPPEGLPGSPVSFSQQRGHFCIRLRNNRGAGVVFWNRPGGRGATRPGGVPLVPEVIPLAESPSWEERQRARRRARRQARRRVAAASSRAAAGPVRIPEAVAEAPAALCGGPDYAPAPEHAGMKLECPLESTAKPPASRIGVQSQGLGPFGQNGGNGRPEQGANAIARSRPSESRGAGSTCSLQPPGGGGQGLRGGGKRGV
ncbi:MAG TPA: hypothetical protein VL523_15465 [Terriglobia bacterium]|nr:hypothetical protein [Terriglobia bacterium]